MIANSAQLLKSIAVREKKRIPRYRLASSKLFELSVVRKNRVLVRNALKQTCESRQASDKAQTGHDCNPQIPDTRQHTN